MKNRIHSLDILRGLAAISILLFHYLKDALDIHLGAESVLSRMGYYGVSIFYVLSGLTLALVYKSNMDTVADCNNYLLKRIARIFPLMILTMLLTIVYRPAYDIKTIFLNITGLFSFFDYTNYIGTGMWSIGNELVFYIFFPFVFYLFQHKKIAFNAVFFLGFLSFIIYSFFATDPESDAWTTYINPVNQFFYFLMGIFLSGIDKDTSFFTKPLLPLAVIIIALLVFVFYPVSGNDDYLIFGVNRLVFSLCCIFLCLAFYSLNGSINSQSIFLKPLIILGEISYGVYLLHPLVSVYFNKFVEISSLGAISAKIKLPIAVIITLGLSYLSYKFFEKKVAKWLTTPSVKEIK
ncbi:MAG: acyltransferase family protein [Bacteroidota bacterium]